jgi:hypothetical protein
MTRISKAQINAAAEAELKATQQAELKRLRAAKTAATKAANKAAKAKLAAAHVGAVQPDPAHVNVEDLFGDLQLPSAKRVLVGAILGVISAGLTGYGVGMLASYAIAGIMVLTGAAWLALALTVITWLIAAYASWSLGGYVGGKVFASVVLPDGLASRSYESLANATSSAASSVSSIASSTRNTVSGWFKREPAVEFTGAHAA